MNDAPEGGRGRREGEEDEEEGGNVDEPEHRVISDAEEEEAQDTQRRQRDDDDDDDNDDDETREQCEGVESVDERGRSNNHNNQRNSSSINQHDLAYMSETAVLRHPPQQADDASEDASDDAANDAANDAAAAPELSASPNEEQLRETNDAPNMQHVQPPQAQYQQQQLPQPMMQPGTVQYGPNIMPPPPPMPPPSFAALPSASPHPFEMSHPPFGMPWSLPQLPPFTSSQPFATSTTTTTNNDPAHDNQPHPTATLVQYYESQMGHHAAAYANAAASAAWIAMQVAQQHHHHHHHHHGTSTTTNGCADPSSSSLPSPGWNAPPIPPPIPTGAVMPSPPPYMAATSPYAASHHQQHYYQQQYYHTDEHHHHNRQHHYPQQQQQQQHAHQQSGSYPSHRIFRRKRSSHQRPDLLEIPVAATAPSASGNTHTNNYTTNTTTNNNNNKVRRRLRSDNDSSSSSSFSTISASGGGHSHNKHLTKKKKITDASLLGKSAVSALHEWCDKRYYQPIFTTTETTTSATAETSQHEASQPQQQFIESSGGGVACMRCFDTTVALEHDPVTILGRGKGSTKYAAKQLAARRALQKLVPGALFDDNTGILVSVNTSSTTATIAGSDATSTMRNLPYQANATTVATNRNDGPEDLAHLAKQLAIQEEDTTISNNSRRSSHHPPKRTLDVYPGTSTTSEDDDCNSDAYYTKRGASVCTSLLFAIIQIDKDFPESPEYSYAVDPAWARRKVSAKTHYTVQRPPNTCTARLKKQQGDGTTIVLEAVGVGANKREARHVASARLLALLFPECTTMTEVKAAAEATRERYARSRQMGRDRKLPPSNSVERSSNNWAAVRQAFENSNFSDATLERIRKHVLSEFKADASEVDTEARQMSRLRQVEVELDRALQRLKDEHESVPEELTEDDVGRTCLRRAGPEDLTRIRKLLFPHNFPRESDEDLTRRLWTASSFVLVLCRAIAPLEDPPLGCAVLTLGFDMAKGKVLRVGQIGNELHLPRERLVECLQTFAVCMKATLVVETSTERIVETMLVRDLRDLLTSYCAVAPPVAAAYAAQSPPTSSSSSSSSLRQWPLQSVQEEQEESEGASSVEHRPQQGNSSKPSKRTRRL